jgi:TPP-dependent pyruvate/acetoin dehydrogenase alpha subunit
MISNHVVTEDDVKKLATRITQETDEAVHQAENDPFPAPREALEGVYADQVVESPLAFADAFFSREK